MVYKNDNGKLKLLVRLECGLGTQRFFFKELVLQDSLSILVLHVHVCVLWCRSP